MNLDVHPYRQETVKDPVKDPVRYQLNGVEENNFYTNIVTNEEGNTLSLETNVYGWKWIDGKYYIFGDNEIIEWDTKENTSSIIYKNDCLNFCEQIYIQSKQDDCGNVELYWQDGKNPDRKLVVDEYCQDRDCCDLLLSDCTDCPKLELEAVQGGAVETGVYWVVAQNPDTKVNCTPVGPISISDTQEFCKGGNEGGIPSGYSIRVSGNNKDNDLYIIKSIAGIVTALSIDTDLYNGTDKGAVDLESLLVDPVNYQISDTSTTFNNKLLRAGLTQTLEIDGQRLANQIKVSACTIRLKTTEGYNIPSNSLMFKSYMRDEVYSVGIKWKNKCTGETTRVFHIPGPSKEEVQQNINQYENCVPEEYQSNICAEVFNEDNWREDCPAKVWEVYNTATITSKPHEDFEIVKECKTEDKTIPKAWECFSLAYHESDCEVYPNIDIPCKEGEKMYGDLTGEPVRYLRMPDTRISCHFSSEKTDDNAVEMPGTLLSTEPWRQNTTKPYEDSYIYPLLLTFDNIPLPESTEDCSEWEYELVSVKRNDSNRTILAKGITHGTWAGLGRDGNYYANPMLGVNSNAFVDQFIQGTGSGGDAWYLADQEILTQFFEANNPNTEWTVDNLVDAHTFHSPNTDVLQYDLSQASYIKLEKDLCGTSVLYGNTNEEDEDVIRQRGSRLNNNLYQSFKPNITNRSLSGIQYAPANSVVGNVSGITYPLNNQFKESSVYLELDKHSLGVLPLQCSGCDSFNVLENNNGAEEASYTDIIGNGYNSTDNSWVLADGYRSIQLLAKRGRPSTHYISIKSDICGYRLDDVFENTIACGLESSTSFVGGDSFINYQSYYRPALWTGYRQVQNGSTFTSTNYSTGSCGNIQSGNTDASVTLNSLIHYWGESDVNMDLRCGEDVYPSAVCKNEKILDPSFQENGLYESTLMTFHMDDDDEESSLPGLERAVKGWRDNDWCYLNDYSKTNCLKISKGIDEDYDVCCNNHLPNRIVWSENESLNNYRDNWGINYANNYIDLPQDKGPITNIINFGNELYVHTEHSLWRLFDNKQLQIEDEFVYIGQGDLLSQTPQELYVADEGYGGLRDQRESLKNEFGYFWSDNFGKKIFRLNGNKDIKEISQIGIRNFIKENLNENFIHMGYDHRHNRLLVTQDQDWTISFDPLHNKWISFHSYVPVDYIYDRCNFYSVKGGIWLHNENCKHTHFYDEKFPWIIETVQKKKDRKINELSPAINSLHLITEMYNKDLHVCESFSRVHIYNHCESSGWLHKNEIIDDETVYNTICNVKGDNKYPYSNYRITEYSETEKDSDQRLTGKYFIVRKEYIGNNNLILLEEWIQ